MNRIVGRVLGDWNRFFFERASGRALGAFRIAFGAVVIFQILLWFYEAPLFLTDEGYLPRTSGSAAGVPWIFRGVYHLGSLAAIEAAIGVTLLAAIAFTVGLYTRVATVLTFLLLISVQMRNPVSLDGADSLVRCLMFPLLFVDAGAALSLDARRRARRGMPAPTVMIWPQRMLQIQISIVYFMAFYLKIPGQTWRDGTAMYYVLGSLDFDAGGLDWMMQYPIAWSLLTHLTMAIEFLLAFGLWFRQTRPYALVLGVCLHIGSLFLLTVGSFATLMIATYLVFLEDDEVAALGSALRRLVPNRLRSREDSRAGGAQAGSARRGGGEGS